MGQTGEARVMANDLPILQTQMEEPEGPVADKHTTVTNSLLSILSPHPTQGKKRGKNKRNAICNTSKALACKEPS
jgi:hypothetical protein